MSNALGGALGPVRRHPYSSVDNLSTVGRNLGPPREAHGLVVQRITLDHSLGNVDVPLLWTWVRTWAVAHDHFGQNAAIVLVDAALWPGEDSWLARGCLMTLLFMFFRFFFW